MLIAAGVRDTGQRAHPARGTPAESARPRRCHWPPTRYADAERQHRRARQPEILRLQAHQALHHQPCRRHQRQRKRHFGDHQQPARRAGAAGRGAAAAARSNHAVQIRSQQVQRRGQPRHKPATIATKSEKPSTRLSSAIAAIRGNLPGASVTKMRSSPQARPIRRRCRACRARPSRPSPARTAGRGRRRATRESPGRAPAPPIEPATGSPRWCTRSTAAGWWREQHPQPAGRILGDHLVQRPRREAVLIDRVIARHLRRQIGQSAARRIERDALSQPAKRQQEIAAAVRGFGDIPRGTHTSRRQTSVKPAGATPITV